MSASRLHLLYWSSFETTSQNLREAYHLIKYTQYLDNGFKFWCAADLNILPWIWKKISWTQQQISPKSSLPQNAAKSQSKYERNYHDLFLSWKYIHLQSFDKMKDLSHNKKNIKKKKNKRIKRIERKSFHSISRRNHLASFEKKRGGWGGGWIFTFHFR